MGILEVHLNDPRFEFAPSVGGRSKRSRLSRRSKRSKQQSGGKQSGSKSGSRRVPAAVVGLVALVGIALAVRRIRGSEEIEREHHEPTHRATSGTTGTGTGGTTGT